MLKTKQNELIVNEFLLRIIHPINHWKGDYKAKQLWGGQLGLSPN
jgi:hypothetical protein